MAAYLCTLLSTQPSSTCEQDLPFWCRLSIHLDRLPTRKFFYLLQYFKKQFFILKIYKIRRLTPLGGCFFKKMPSLCFLWRVVRSLAPTNYRLLSGGYFCLWPLTALSDRVSFFFLNCLLSRGYFCRWSLLLSVSGYFCRWPLLLSVFFRMGAC
jgi:hypothetical protein